ncbi:S-phase kinase-associated protein 1A [Aphelenchoides avenae]|nr:S-phase kinase-associated protein 1A [Aphelenchus avenae]
MTFVATMKKVEPDNVELLTLWHLFFAQNHPDFFKSLAARQIFVNRLLTNLYGHYAATYQKFATRMARISTLLYQFRAARQAMDEVDVFIRLNSRPRFDDAPTCWHHRFVTTCPDYAKCTLVQKKHIGAGARKSIVVQLVLRGGLSLRIHMSAPSANNVGGPRQVTCEISNKEHVVVDIDDLLVSHTFKDMCEKLGLEGHDEYPGVFPVRDISSHVFMTVIAWCKEHKGLPDPVIEKDAVTQVVKWLDLSPTHHGRQPARHSVSLPGHCQAIATLMKGKGPGEVRLILRQRSDLSWDDIKEIFDRNPWLEERYERGADVEEPIHIPAEVLVTILEKLPRSDIERFQLVSSQFLDVVLGNQKPLRKLSAERGPLTSVNVQLGTTLDSYHDVGPVDEVRYFCRSVDSFAQRLKFCRVRKLRTPYRDEFSDALLKAPVPLKRAWKDATFDAFLRCFSSDEQFRFAFTEVFMCKEVRLIAFQEASFLPQPFLRLPGIWQCSVLEIGYGIRGQQASDIREWLEGGAPKQLVIRNGAIAGGFERLVDALKTTFLEADHPQAYKVRIRFVRQSQTTQHLWDDKTKENLEIRMDGDDDLIVERK